jgi:hypothetical protein
MSITNLVRQICRACHCVHSVPVGTDLGGKDFRCDSCNASDYERRHFERSMQTIPSNVEATDDPEATDGVTESPDEVADHVEITEGDQGSDEGPQSGGAPEEPGAPEASSGDSK